MAPDQRGAVCPLAPFCYYLTSPLQNQALYNVTFCLLLDESFLQSLSSPCFQTLAWTHKWTQSAMLPAAAIAAWPKYKKAKKWLTKTLSRSSCGINKNLKKVQHESAGGRRWHIPTEHSRGLFSDFSRFLRKQERRKQTESYILQGRAPSSPAMLWLLHHLYFLTEKGINSRN